MSNQRHLARREINPRLLRYERMRRCVLAECRGACCLHGVWVSRDERDMILAQAERIGAQMPATLRDPQVWFDGGIDQDNFIGGEIYHTNVLPDRGHYGGTACVFLREDFKCALQCAGDAAGLHPWRFKPYYCILHPLDLDEEGRISLDETGELLGEEGSCLRPADEEIPLLELFAAELEALADEAALREARRSLNIEKE